MSFIDKAVSRLRSALQGLKFGPSPAGHDFDVRPDDIFLVSYPKSGNTWIRFILANIQNPDREIDIDNVWDIIPDIHSHTEQDLDAHPDPRIIKSHDPFDYRYPRTTYIVRDPRSVAVSYFYYQKRRGDIPQDEKLSSYVHRFLAGGHSPYGGWGEHVRSWLALRGNDDNRFHLVRYEDLQENCVGVAEQLTKFLGWSVDETVIRQAVEASRFDRLKDQEEEASSDWQGTEGAERQNIRFFRKGKTNEWREALSEESLHELETAYGGLMMALGYEPVTVETEELDEPGRPIATATSGSGPG